MHFDFRKGQEAKSNKYRKIEKMKLTSDADGTIDVFVEGANLVSTLIFQESEDLRILDIHGFGISVAIPSHNDPATFTGLRGKSDISMSKLVLDPLFNRRRLPNFLTSSQTFLFK